MKLLKFYIEVIIKCNLKGYYVIVVIVKDVIQVSYFENHILSINLFGKNFFLKTIRFILVIGQQ